MDRNKAGPLQKKKVKAMGVDRVEWPQELMQKPYVLNDLETEASLPEKKGYTVSWDLMYVPYMVENHGEDYKAMAQDEKNYYQDNSKPIRNKIKVYKRFSQQNGKPSLILCRKIRWRLSDWFKPAQAEASSWT